MPTLPTKAAQRSPSHRMRPRRRSANARGMRSRSLSSSVVNRGQSYENEQQAPQLRQSEAASGDLAAMRLLLVVKSCTSFPVPRLLASAERSLGCLPDQHYAAARDVDHIGMESSKRRRFRSIPSGRPSADGSSGCPWIALWWLRCAHGSCGPCDKGLPSLMLTWE
jgi:hypothetical protein